jgi:hypothetical protein
MCLSFIKKTTGVAIGSIVLYTDDLFSIPAHYLLCKSKRELLTILKDKNLKIEQYVSARDEMRSCLIV